MTIVAPPAAAPVVDIEPFVTSPWLRNGHVMTVYAWARRRSFPHLPAPELRFFRVSADTQVRADCFWQPDRAARPVLLALHGLESSSEAHYMRGLADHALARGWSAVLLNQRNCGGTEHLTPGLYSSGLTADPLAVIQELADRDGIRDVVIAAYSLGGNLALKLAGELGDSGRVPVRAVAAISPVADLDRCVRAIERRSNYPYQWNFVRNLRGRMRRKVACWPGSFDLAPLGGIWSIRKFDEIYTAPHHGFANALDYYTKASALRVVDRIRIPALILTADDDPFVPGDQFRAPDWPANPHVTVRIEKHGGHCGFIGSGANGRDAYWAEATAVTFLAAAIASRT
ncbi:MAG TPA: alpha/beta fold hydrolase [Vicinamibacterales bacterium]|nr:alpha/beta fold hydrolase [Vicinamibacterales bacterium]